MCYCDKILPMNLSIVLLAYKEESNLKVLIPRIKSVLDGVNDLSYEIIVIDTKSPLDNTKGVCDENGALYYNQEMPGFGGAYNMGINVASGDAILFLDSDGSHDPSYIVPIINKYNEGLDLVIGSRYTDGGITKDEKSSQIMSKILNFVFRIVLGVKIRDVSTNFRIYKSSVVRGMNLKSVNYDVLEEIILLMKNKVGKKNFKYAEVPISFNKRLYGESKRRLIPFVISYIKTIFRLLYIRFTSSK